jgi:hypothetical protein
MIMNGWEGTDATKDAVAMPRCHHQAGRWNVDWQWRKTTRGGLPFCAVVQVALVRVLGLHVLRSFAEVHAVGTTMGKWTAAGSAAGDCRRWPDFGGIPLPVFSGQLATQSVGYESDSDSDAADSKAPSVCSSAFAQRRLCAAASSTPNAPGPTPMTAGKATSGRFDVIDDEFAV